MPDTWERLEVFTTRFEAEVVVALLRDAGIPARLLADDVGGAFPDLFLGKGVPVLVHAADLTAARDLLDASPTAD